MRRRLRAGRPRGNSRRTKRGESEPTRRTGNRAKEVRRSRAGSSFGYPDGGSDRRDSRPRSSFGQPEGARVWATRSCVTRATGRRTVAGPRQSRGMGNRFVARSRAPEMRKEGSKTRAGRRHGDGAVGLLAVDTLRAVSKDERASEGSSSERRERRAPGKLGLSASSEGLEERNSRRGATLVRVNNAPERNAPPCGRKPRSRGTPSPAACASG